MKKSKYFSIIRIIMALGLFFTSLLFSETYHYDATGRLSDVIYDDGRFIHYSYDKNGNTIQKSANVVQMFSNGFE